MLLTTCFRPHRWDMFWDLNLPTKTNSCRAYTPHPHPPFVLWVLFSWWTERLEKRLADWYRRRSVLRELIFDAERSDDEEEIVATWGGGAHEEEVAAAAAVAAEEQQEKAGARAKWSKGCLLYTSPSPRDRG